MIITLFVSISAVSAVDISQSDNLTLLTQNNNVYEIPNNSNLNNEILSLSEDNAILSASDSDDDILGDAGDRNALQNLINNAGYGSNVTLPNNYKFTTGYSSSTGIYINKDVTIDGNGHTIDANQLGKIFYVYSDYTVTFKNIKFINAYSTSAGGAIYSSGSNITIINCTFDSNEVSHSSKGGGALYTNYAQNTQINIINSTFTNNKGSNGGSLHFDNPNNLQNPYYVNIEGCNFTGNSLNSGSGSLGGGAIIIYRAVEANIKSSIFVNNKAQGKDGGAIRYSGSTTVTGCEFYSNTAAHGAALCFGQAVDLNVYDSIFANNSATSQGGAVKARYFEMDNVNFTNNTATSGGAVFSRSGSGTLENAVFTNNTATSGGAVYVHEEVNTLVISDVDFIDNHATSGGALYSNAKGTVNTAGSSFTNNTANSGGAVFIYQGKAIIGFSEFENNTATIGGGAVYVRANNAEIKNSLFKNNSAPLGGAAYWHENALNGKISESNFVSNDGINGSSIHWRAGSGTVEKSTFDDDNITLGSIYWHGSNGKIVESIFLTDKAVYLCGHSNVNLEKNKELAPESGSYSVYNGNNATFIENEFNNVIYNYGIILSPVYIKSLNNSTVMSNSESMVIYTTVTDDNGNYIDVINNLVNVFDSQNLSTTYNKTHFVSTVTKMAIGEHTVSSTGYDTSCFANLTVQNGGVIYLILNLTVNQTNFGEKVVITVDIVNTTYNDTVDIALNDVHYNVTLKNGTGVLTLYNLAPNTYDIVASFMEYNQTLSTDVIIKVELRNSTINITANNIYYGNVATININTTNGTTGNVYVFINNKMYIVKLVNSTGQLNLTGLPGGNHTVHAFYNGDALFDSSYNDTSFMVYKFEPQINITVKNIYVGQIATIKVELPRDATGKIHIDIGDKEYVYVNKTTITIYESNLTAGNISVRVNYLGDNKYYVGNKTVYFNVTKKTMNMRVETADIPVGENATISVIIPSDAKGIVLLTVNGTNYFEYANGTVAKFIISGLTQGSYNVTAVYAEGPIYKEANASSSFNVNYVHAYDFNVTARTDSDLNVYVDISLPKDIDGDVYVEINGTNYTAHMSKGKDTVIISGLTGGEYNGTVYLVNDSKYYSSNRTFTVDLIKVSPNIHVIYNHTIYVGDDAIIKVKLNDDATGNVTITINNTKYIEEIENGEAKFNITGLVWHTYQFNVTYDGDRKYLPDQKEHTLEVSRIHNYYSYLETHDIFVGENATVTVTFENDTTGSVTLLINGSTYTINLKNGTGSINITGLPVGKHIINATYNGDKKYEPCNRIFEDFHVKKIIDYPFTVDNEVNDTHANITVTLPDDADGYVNITINNQTYSNIEVKAGKANLTVGSLEAGKTYVAKVDYSGNNKYGPGSRHVTLNSTKTLNYEFIVQGDSIHVGDVAHIIVTIPEAQDGDRVVITVHGSTESYNMFIQNKTVDCPIIGLKDGEYNVLVEYEGNSELESSAKLTHIYVSKISSFKFDVLTNEPYVGENLTIDIQLPSDSGGNVNVTVSINNTNYTSNVTNGSARVIIPNLPAGVYNATVYYSGDEKYHDAVKSVEVVVEKIDDYVFVVTPVDIYVGQNETIKIELPKDINGTVIISILNTTYINRIVDVENGTGWFNVTGLARGDYVVNVNLKNDGKYEDDTVYVNFKVSLVDDYLFDVSVSDPNYVRDNITFTIHLPTNATGNVTVTIFTKDHQAVVNNGVAIVNITAKEYGTFPYRVSFQEEGKYALKSHTGSVVVSKLDVNLTPDVKSPVNVGENITIKIKLPEDATGTITVITRMITYTETLVNGSANITLPGYPLAQTYSPSVSYSGDDRYNANTTVVNIVVEKLSDYNLTLNVSDIDVGQVEIVNITLPADATDDVLIYGNFSDRRYSQSINKGNVTFNIANLDAGTYNITVLYQGYDKYVSKNVTKIFTVRKVNSTIAIDLINRTIVVSLPENANGTVRIAIDTIDEDVAIVNGKAILDVSGVDPGEYLVTAIFDGDKNYLGNSTSKTVVIPKFSDYLINVTVDDIIVGENATVIVSLPSDANGFVNITVNKTLYQDVEVKNGVAKFNVAKLGVGTYDVLVNFTNNKYALNGNSTTFRVNKITTVLIPAVTTADRNVTVVVGINKNATGNITVYIDNTPYIREIKDNKVNATFSDLLPGDHIVIAHYDGDDNFTSADTSLIMFEIYPITDYELLINLTKLITVVQNNTVTVTFPEYAHGRITIYVNDEFYNAEIDPDTHNATVVLPWLNEGNYTVSVSYMDELYDYKENFTVFKVIKLNTTIGLEVENITKDMSEFINITLNENATGDVLIDVNGTVYHETLENGKATLTLDNLKDGNYTVIVTYEGSDFFNINQTSINFTVSKMPVNITINASDIIVGHVLTIKFNMSREITDLVTVQVGDTNYTTFSYKGNGSLDVYNLPVGNYNITVYYAGSDDYLAASNKTNINVVGKKTSQMNVTVADITVGENITVYVNTTKGINGPVYVTIAGLAYTGVIVDGKANLTVSNLTARDYTVSAFFMGNDEFELCNATSTFTVHKKNAILDLDVSDININQLLNVSVKLPKDATGYVLININGTEFYADIINGTANYTIPPSKTGHFVINVTYLGDNNYLSNVTNGSYNVFKVKTLLNVTGEDITVGQSATFNITMTANITEVVIVNVAAVGDSVGKNYTTFVENGNGSFTVYDLPAGDYVVSVFFPGNTQYGAVNNTTSIKVNGKKASQVTVNVDSITVGENATVFVSVTDGATGSVMIVVAGDTYIKELNASKANFTLSGLIARDYHVTAYYLGDTYYDLSNSSAEFTVSKRNTGIVLDVADIRINETEVINVTVNENATGYVLISIDDIHVYANITGGRAVAVIDNLAVGKYNVTVTYIGDDNFNGNSTNNSFTVTKLDTTIAINGSDIYVGQSVTFNITTSANFTEVVIVNVAAVGDSVGKNYTTFVENGNGSFTVYDLPAGDYVVSVFFPGNTQYGAVNNTTSIKVNGKKASQVTVKVYSITVGENATVFVNVTDGATGSVMIVVAGDTYIKELNASKANFTLSGLIARDYHVTAYYLGDTYYDTSNSTANFTVNKKLTSVNATAKDAIVGNSTTISVNVTEGATGVVLIDVNGTKYYSNITNAKATVTVPNLAVGKYNVTVTYLGDDKFHSNETNTSFTVSKVVPEIAISLPNGNQYAFGDAVIIHLTGPKDVTGVVLVKVASSAGHDEYTAYINNGEGDLTIIKPDVDSYNVSAVYQENHKYYSNKSNNLTFSVYMNAGLIDVNTHNINVGENETIDVILRGNHEGNVSIIVEGTEYNRTMHYDADKIISKAVLNLTTPDAGIYNVKAVFTETVDGKTIIYEGTSVFTVSKIASSIIISPIDDIKVGENATIKLDGFPTDINTTIDIYVNGKHYTVNSTNATLIVPNLQEGVVTVQAVYNENNKYLLSINETAFHVYKNNITPKLDVSNIYINETAEINVTLPEDAKGYVLININGTKYYGDVVGGVAKFLIPSTAAGTFTVNATYLGDNKYYSNSTIGSYIVSKLKTDLNVTGEDITVGQSATFNITMTANITEVVIVNVAAVGDSVGKNYTTFVENGNGSFTVYDLPTGDYIVSVFFPGNTHYGAVNNTATIKVNGKKASQVSVNVDSITVGENATVFVNVTDGATGSVMIVVAGDTYIKELNASKANFTLSGLIARDYHVTAYYLGDTYYDTSNSTAEFKVIKNAIELTLDVGSDISVGDAKTITVTLNVSDATGNVIITVNNMNYSAPIVGNVATLTLNDLTNGTYSVKAIYEGNNKYLDNKSSEDSFTVNKLASTTSVDDVSINVGEVAEITVKVTSGATGTVTVTVGEVPYTAGLVDSKAVVYVKGLTKGEYDINAVYNGDNKYVGFKNVTSKVTVAIVEDFDMLAIASNTSVGGQSVVEIILPGDAQGTVTIGDITENVVNGRATITLPKETAVGNKTVTVVYNGDNVKYNAKSVDATYNVVKYGAEKSPSAISIDVNKTYHVGDSIVIGLTPINSTGAITVTINGEEYPVEDNKVTIPNGLDANSYTVVANLAGDDNYESSSSTATFEVIKYDSNIKIDVKDVFAVDDDIVITLTTENATGVVVTINGKSYTVKDNKVTIPKGLANGTYFVNAEFGGDNKYMASQANASFVVNKVTPTNVEVKDLTFVVGHEGILEISGPSDRVANLIVSVGGIDYAVELNGGKATLDVSGLTAGEFNVDVTYIENDKYTAAEFSNAASINVKDKDKADVDVTVDTENKTITVELPENATGNVTVVIDGKVYNVSNASESPIVIDISSIAPGNHTVEVIYSGDDNYNKTSATEDITIPKDEDYQFDLDVTVDGDKATIAVELPEDINGPVLVDVDGKGYYINVTDGKGTLEVTDLAPGKHTVTAKYPGNDKYAAMENTTIFETSGKVHAPINIEANDIEIGDDLEVVVSVPSDAEGDITLKVDGKTYTEPINKGKAKFVISDLGEGNYTIEATYPGDNKYQSNSSETEVEVSKVKDYPMDVTVDGRDITVQLPDDAEGNVTVIVDGKEYTAKVENGTATVNVPDLTSGKHNITAVYGDDKYAPKEKTSIIDVENKLFISAPEVIKYYSGSERFYVYVEDMDGPIANATISITINNVSYTRITDERGVASLAINLNSNEYPVLVTFKGNDEFNETSVSSKVIVRPTIYGNDVFKVFMNGTQYYALFTDGEGNPLVNTNVSFNINGVFYTRSTNASGWARLNINLYRGEYVLTAMNPVTGEFRSNNVTVISLIIENKDITKYFCNGTQYSARIIKEDGSVAGAGEAVTFNINGVFYTRYTDDNGYVNLNINLQPGDYIITAYYKNCAESNHIKVLPTLITNDLVMNYGDGSKFVAHVVDGQGNPYPNQMVFFNVHGIIYNKLTDSEGNVELNINLQKGKYLITSVCNDEVHSNNIFVI